jgi:hypothetical protein
MPIHPTISTNISGKSVFFRGWLRTALSKNDLRNMDFQKRHLFLHFVQLQILVDPSRAARTSGL